MLARQCAKVHGEPKVSPCLPWMSWLLVTWETLSSGFQTGYFDSVGVERTQMFLEKNVSWYILPGYPFLKIAFTEAWLTYNKPHIFKGNILIHFDKCRHPWKHHHSQVKMTTYSQPCNLLVPFVIPSSHSSLTPLPRPEGNKDCFLPL